MGASAQYQGQRDWQQESLVVLHGVVVIAQLPSDHSLWLFVQPLTDLYKIELKITMLSISLSLMQVVARRKHSPASPARK